MAYPRELLNDGEELSLDLRPHWWYFAKHFLFGFVLLAFAVLIAFLPKGSQDADVGSLDAVLSFTNRIAKFLWVGIVLFWVVMLVFAYLQWIFTLFVVTTDRVIYRTGIIAKNGVEIPLERINNINFSQSIFERIIGAGDLMIESAGEAGQSLFCDVRHPDAVQQEINRCREINDRKSASYIHEARDAAAISTQLSIPEQIEKLAQLKEQNIITEAEFLDKKQRLLDQM